MYLSILFIINYMKINSIIPQENNYLQILDDIAGKPKRLYCLGKLPDNRLKSVAIVGSRKPTTYGKEVTYQIAYDLAKQGIVIISGLALGIDAIAHQGALDAGGTTIAVLASGLDNITPTTNRNLAMTILKNGGAIISEYQVGTAVKSYQFLARNRIVSGLSDMVLVTEAAARSGTLSTVGHALDQGREVGAVPGPITSILSVGCNSIIQKGAHLITSASDVFDILSIHEPNHIQSRLPLGNTQIEVDIVNLIQNGINDGEDIIKQINISSSEFSSAITMLEINGVVKSLGGNKWTIS